MANYQLNKTGAEIDAALELAVEHETSKANVDGAYEGLTAGNAEQLVSSVFVEDKVPYNFRTSGGSADIGNRLKDKIVGGTLAWNQMVSPSAIASSKTENGITFTNNGDGSVTVNGTASADASFRLFSGGDVPIYGGVIKFYICGCPAGGSPSTYYCGVSETNPQNYGLYDAGNGKIGTYVYGFNYNIYIKSGASVTNLVFKPQVFNLIKMFGSTIADYVYSLEQANAGAGVEWFKKLFPKPYYAYNAGTLMSVKAGAHNTIGFNAYDHATGKAKLVGGNVYQITGTYTALAMNSETITPDASGYFTPSADGELIVTGGNATDTCVHLKWDGERDGEYEEYVKHEYALDDSLELRGIAKLDANNDMYYDGDEYESDGKVTRKYGIVDLGTLTWTYGAIGAGVSENGFYSVFNTIKAGTINILCPKYTMVGARALINADKQIAIGNTTDSKTVFIRDDSYTDAATFKTAMSGVYLVYELANATEESADPFTNPQIVDDFGTEEYVDYAEAAGDRDVAIPVGHETEYQNNLRAKLEMSPNSPDGNGDYIVRQTDGINEYVPLVIPTELPAAPSSDGTYHLKVVVSDGTATISWEAET